jgi:hypothetical protein
MSEPAGSFSQRAFDIVAEDKIRSAIADGQFANLPGLGQPHPIFDEPYDPHWWIRRKLQRESLTELADKWRLTD